MGPPWGISFSPSYTILGEMIREAVPHRGDPNFDIGKIPVTAFAAKRCVALQRGAVVCGGHMWVIGNSCMFLWNVDGRVVVGNNI